MPPICPSLEYYLTTAFHLRVRLLSTGTMDFQATASSGVLADIGILERVVSFLRSPS
jgi:hypothetical protein